jgi:HAD superfamily hydrolase (TIGR01509 family)
MLSSMIEKELKCVVLDAMGVIYAGGDDVNGLLHPFIVEKGGIDDLERIKAIYLDASLGKIRSADFWRAVGVDPEMENEYLLRHRLSRGLMAFLKAAHRNGIELWCLSNDVSEWSQKLRIMHGLDKYIRGYVISGDAGLRKPDAAIYRLLLDRLKRKPGETCFVDDQIRNLNAAAAMGIITVLFDPVTEAETVNGHPVVNSFASLNSYLEGGSK